MTQQIIREAEDSQIVKDQRANPKTDVFTGKTFQELADSSKDRFQWFRHVQLVYGRSKQAFCGILYRSIGHANGPLGPRFQRNGPVQP